ncbi:SLC13 family permease [soil metagenome]
MSGAAWLTVAVLLLTVVALTRDLVPPAVAVLGANITLLVSGVITTEQALAGFSNPAPMTVAALFIVARAVEKTGGLQPLVRRTLGAGHGERASLARLLVPVAGASGFLNNTPLVAMLTPQIAAWAEKHGRSASLYLMPLSFATILGGTITVIGTSTNLVVSGLLQANGMAPLGMFELSMLGVPLAAVGVTAIVLLAPVTLPARRTPRQDFTDNVREYVCQATIAAGGPIDGISVDEARLRNLEGVFLVEIQRGAEVLAPVAPTSLLRGGDRLTFAGRVDLIRDIHATSGLVPDGRKHALTLNGPQHTFFEAVIGAASPLAGKTLKEIDFRSRYQAAVLAIHRAGERVNEKLGTVRLREGDTLLLIADGGFGSRWRDRHDFLLVSHLGGTPRPGSKQAVLVGALTFAIVVLAGVGLLPILHAALLGAFALVLFRVLSPSEARGAIELDVIAVIAAAFGLASAIESSGLAATLGSVIVHGFDEFGPVGVLLAVTLATVALTELITNNAAAVLLFPIAVATAVELGLDPRPFAIAITVAASASFLTPIGYQTNTMVYGPGGYRFSDYIRLGLPLTLLVVAAIVILVPLIWPLAGR